MRLDQFLRASRLVLRRTIAQELCDAGAVSVNDSPARSSRTVRAGDEITLNRRDHILRVRVRAVPTTKQISRTEAPSLYEIISDGKTNDE
ncbi:MAG: RNA-binding S4 domain-containing protein [Acidobacteria bacterium]|nr:RNA-binding S4 domain-containing protein [Acidobacteriota bacterium]